jgi:hypothetical protein
MVVRFISFVAALVLLTAGVHSLLKGSTLWAIGLFVVSWLASALLYKSSPYVRGTLTTAPHPVGLGRFAKWLVLASIVGIALSAIIKLVR